MAVGGELEAAEKVRVLSDGRSGEAPTVRKGSGGRSGDAEHGGVLNDDGATTVAAQFEVLGFR